MMMMPDRKTKCSTQKRKTKVTVRKVVVIMMMSIGTTAYKVKTA